MNKSANHSSLSIIVKSKTNSTVTYALAHTSAASAYTWKASTGTDHMVLDSVEVGRKYFVRVQSDKYGTQHWLEATAIDAPKPVIKKTAPPANAREFFEF